MNKRIPTFLAGMLTAALIGTLSIGALAATGQLTITVDPINIQVNGQTFAPKDANGNSVPVFAYNGTTYAPLRALAEAYGLEVGYDAGKNMATVGAKAADPATTPAPDTALSDNYSTWSAAEEKAYQEFKGMWTIGRVADNKSFVGLQCYKLVATGDSISEAERIGEAAVDKFLSSNTVEFTEKCCSRFSWELYKQYEVPEIRYGFELYGSWGWVDRFSADGLTCGYRDFLKYSTLP